MRKLTNIMLSFLIIGFILVVGLCTLFNYGISAKSREFKEISVEVPSGYSTKAITKILEDEGIIRNAKIYNIYLKIYKVNNIKAGLYKLSPSMDAKEITKVLTDGNSYNPDEIRILFKEGKNMRSIASVIANNTNNTEDDVFALLKDNDYLDSVIEKYWFIDDSIKNKDIYYALEGYLFPETYYFTNKDVSVEDIFDKMLKQTDKVLSKYKDDIEKSKYSVHELLTLASIIEQEANSFSDRELVSSVFYNRLRKTISLGSDVTTYYALKVDLSERALSSSEFATINPYNTRSVFGIPVGPICNPSEDSIKAAINPKESDYLYFVSDSFGKMYFSLNEAEQARKIKELKEKGFWFEY